jgi:hypothetical protein
MCGIGGRLRHQQHSRRCELTQDVAFSKASKVHCVTLANAAEKGDSKPFAKLADQVVSARCRLRRRIHAIANATHLSKVDYEKRVKCAIMGRSLLTFGAP